MQVGFCWVTHAPIRDSRYRDDMVPDFPDSPTLSLRLPTHTLPWIPLSGLNQPESISRQLTLRAPRPGQERSQPDVSPPCFTCHVRLQQHSSVEC